MSSITYDFSYIIDSYGMPALNDACFDFLEKMILPAVLPDNIVKGWQNYHSLPAGTNDFAVFAVGNQSRRGTNVRTFTFDPLTPDPGILTIETMWQVAFQFDFSGTDDNLARSRAACCASLCRDAIGVQHFKKYGAAMNFAQDPQAVPIRDENNNWVPRWLVKATGTYWASVDFKVDWFDDAALHLISVNTKGE